MTLADVENAMRVEAKTWAESNGLVFSWDNSTPKDPGAARTLLWQFKPSEPEQLTDQVLRHQGVVEASIFVAGGAGFLVPLQLGEGLQSLFSGRVFAGGEVLGEITIGTGVRVGTGYSLTVTIPWEFVEKRVPRGAVGLQETPGAITTYQAFRQRWESLVRAPLSLKSFFDNSPPEPDELPPWAFVSFRLLAPVRIETHTIRVPGRVISALNYPLGSGVKAANDAIAVIEHSFHQCTFRGICFGTPTVNRVGRTPADTWQANVRLPFHYDVRI